MSSVDLTQAQAALTTAVAARLEELRGWTPAALERLGVGFDGSRIVLPVHGQDGELVGCVHYEPDPSRRNGPKMLADAGTTRELFPPPEMIADEEVDGLLALTEGEPDGVRLWSLGMPAVAVPGAENWKDEWASRFTGRHLTVAVCFDCDEAGRSGAVKVATSLVAAGVDVRVIDLAPERDDGYDLSDFLAGDTTADALRTLAEQAVPFALPAKLRVVGLDEFADTDEPGAEAILGDAAAPLIPEGGDAMVYGDGGVGKTTLAVDLAFHLAAGDSWLGMDVPRKMRVLLIENEGPRPLFRKKLARKRDAWVGSPVGDRIDILELPWGEFSFAAPEWRQLLAEQVSRRQVDVVIAGPVTASGMDEAGTMQQVRAFIKQVDEVRRMSGRPIAVLLIHHENKGGSVSGAWEGAADTLLHVQEQGHGRLRVYIQKARWASQQHRTTLQLLWSVGDGFALAEAEPDRPERTWENIAAYVLAHGGCAWNEVAVAVSGNRDYLARRRDHMLADGILVNVGSRSGFRLWHRDDPARPSLDLTDSEVGIAAESPDSTTGDGGGTTSDSAIPVRSRESLTESVGSTSPADYRSPLDLDDHDADRRSAGRSTS